MGHAHRGKRGPDVEAKRRQHLYESVDENPAEDGQTKQVRPKQFADWRDLPNELLEQQEIRDAILQALLGLPESYREIFILRDMEQVSVAEAAEILGISVPLVKTRLHRARLMMREALTPIFARPKVSIWERWKGVNPWSAAKR
jgi:RNA polymerase sigma-70 factor, ECF subfamily